LVVVLAAFLWACNETCIDTELGVKICEA